MVKHRDIAGGVLAGSTMTLLGFIWFYGLLYNWVWLGLTHSSSTGWLIGYTLLFIIFAVLSIPAVILLGIGYFISYALIMDS